MGNKIELISVQNTENSIVITIPKSLLKFVAKNHPAFGQIQFNRSNENNNHSKR